MRWYRRMGARERHEEHRAATPLELFFDLCFVVAVAQAGTSLHHALAENHFGLALVRYLMVFFAIWWAWMNFTWFASAYDTDDGPYRVTTFVQIAGALVLAAGIPRAFDDGDFLVVVIGYVIMRIAIVSQWLRAARSDPPRRTTAIRYAAGVAIMQALWVAFLFAPSSWALPLFVLFVGLELLVPVLAERTEPTTWHPHHIAERYGLFTLIVLGESVLAATLAFQGAIDAGGHSGTLIGLAVAGLVIVFSMWWIYFDKESHELLSSAKAAFRWGYGHYLIFGSTAAVGAGLAVAVDYDTGKAHLSGTAAGFAVAIPVAVYLLTVWLLQICPHRDAGLKWVFPVAAGLALLTPFTGAPIHLTAGILAVVVAVMVLTGRDGSAGRRAASSPAAGIAERA
ncbi:low temperature requirement protein A [Longispora albida]|uniref:low temperature requirement protein A n=1 Tax=Longispora albida TaxID=203523 RepID=UPI00036B0CAD|nr:low temperature requirement protein A [Longispora albida]